VRELTHLDLFAGASGFSTGLRPCGYRTAVGVEMWRPATASFRLNHPGVPVIERDIRSVTGGEVAAHLPAEGGRYREADLVTAGIPCQTFSRAGKGSHRTFDHRQTLFREVVRIARATRARVVLLENVSSIQDKPITPGGTNTVDETIRRELAEAGYANQIEGVLLAADFRVPQNRFRWFLLAARDSSLRLRLPEPTGPLVTVSEAFAGLPDDLDEDGYTNRTSPFARLMRDDAWWRLPRRSDRPTQHETYDHPATTVARYAMLRPGMRVANLFDELDPSTLARLQAMDVLPNKPFNLSGDKLSIDRPGFTVTGNACDRMVHPRRNRAITVREAARLQSFPDSFEFSGSKKDMYQQVGNAVPCLLAFHLGLAVRAALTGDVDGLRVPHLDAGKAAVREEGSDRG
jgi:DNA (cytosine-5)-methyltransferase 1